VQADVRLGLGACAQGVACQADAQRIKNKYHKSKVGGLRRRFLGEGGVYFGSGAVAGASVPTLLLQTAFPAFYKSYDKLCISSFICYPHALASGIPVGSLTAMPSDKVRLIRQSLLQSVETKCRL
jgi:hypothetical protein